jgi:hypothetical protein
MKRHLTEEGGVNLKGLVLVCLMLVSLVSSLVLIRPASAPVEKLDVNVISLRESFDEPQFGTGNNYDTINIAGCGATSSPGEPTVPAKTITVPLPSVNDISNIEVTSPSQTVDYAKFSIGNEFKIVKKPDVNVISLRESFNEPQFEVENNYDVVSIEGCGMASSPGTPTVPAKTITVLLPPGKDVSNIDVTPVRQVQVERELYLYPGQEPVPLSADSPSFTRPNAEVYSSLAPYPSQESYELEFVTSYRGYKLAVIRLFPIQYIPAERMATFYPELDVRVELEPASEAGLAFRPTADVDDWVRSNVENPELVNSYSSSTSGGDAQYLIITRPMFLDALQPLVALKSKRMTVKVVTVDDIVVNYPSGRDIPEKIRKCIIDHYTSHGTQWVLLAGDADFYDLYQLSAPRYVLDNPWEVPTRYVWNPVDDLEEACTGLNWHYQPTDYYYAGLDGTWDADGDGRFGENKAVCGVGIDEADWFADVYVGRMTIGRMPAPPEEYTMQAIVNKTVAREIEPQRSIDNVSLFGDTLFDAYRDGKTLKRYIKNTYLQSVGNVYEYYTQDGTLDSQAFINDVNAHDPMVINAAGHGNPYYMSFVDTTTPAAITNSGFTMYAMACMTNAFDVNEGMYSASYDPCLGEALLRDPDGGAVGYIGATRLLATWEDSSRWLTWGGPGQDVKFFEEVFQNHEFRQGAALYESKRNYITSDWYYSFDWPQERADLFVTMLLGDPEFDMRSRGIQPFSYIHWISRYWQNQIPFTITASAFSEVGVARVELWYRYYSSNGSGWGSWQNFGVGTNSDDGWSWSFTAPAGDGDYEFYSIAVDVNNNTEQPPIQAYARAGFDRVSPGVPVPSLPQNDAHSVANILNFKWSAAQDDRSGISYYRLVVDNDSDFSSPVLVKQNLNNNNTYTTTAGEIPAYGTYYWRVLVTDWAGNESGWSATWSFTTFDFLSWQRFWGRADDERGYGVVVGRAGIYVAGGINNGSGNEDAFLVRYDESGNITLIDYLGLVVGGKRRIFANGIAAGPEGIYVVGKTWSDGAYYSDAFIVRYNEGLYATHSLQEVWGGAYNDEARDVAVGSDGYVYVVGYTEKSGGRYALLLKYDRYCRLVWAKEWGGISNNAEAYGIAAGSDGYIYVVGENNGKAFLLKCDSSGSIVGRPAYWDASQYDPNYDIAVGSDGIYVVGHTSACDAFLSKYDSSCNLLWKRNCVGSNPAEDDAQAYGVAVGSDGSVYVSGSIEANTEVFLRRYDESGNLWWENTWGKIYSESHSYMVANGIAVASDGVYVTGWAPAIRWSYDGRDPRNGNDVFLSKFYYPPALYSSPIWYRTWPAQPGNQSEDYTLSVAADGNYIYTGGSTWNTATGNFDFLLLKYDKNGTLQPGWPKTWDSGNNDFGKAIAVNYDGVYMVGSKSTSDKSYQGVILKYDKNGNLLQAKDWGGNGDDFFNDISLMDYGCIYVAGTTSSYGAGKYDVVLLQYDSNCNLLNYVTWGGTGDDQGEGLMAAEDVVYVCGSTDSGLSNQQAFLLMYDPNPTLTKWWEFKWGGSLGDQATSVTIAADGSVYVAGMTEIATGNCDGFLRKYSSAGLFQWENTFDNPTNHGLDQFRGVTTLGNNVYVTGWTVAYGSTRSDLILLKYDSSGAELWRNYWGDLVAPNTYDAGGDVAVGSNGIYVTGCTSAPGADVSEADALLIKYYRID